MEPNLGGAIILLYHRIDSPPSDAQLLCVSPQHFDEHLSVLRERSPPIALRDLTDRLASGATIPDTAIVTFDDGYADNLESAQPILARHAAPATVFITPTIDPSPEPFWWDELEQIHLVDSPHSAPGWNVLQRERAGARERAYLESCDQLRTMPDGARRRALDQIRAKSGGGSVRGGEHGPLARANLSRAQWNYSSTAGAVSVASSAPARLTEPQIVQLARHELIEIGAHTLTHPVLSQLEPAEQRHEILESKQALESMIDRPVTSLSYPYGTRRDYTAETVAIVREAGFARACANRPGRIAAATDPFQLPRFVVRDWDGDEFAKRLDAWRRGLTHE